MPKCVLTLAYIVCLVVAGGAGATQISPQTLHQYGDALNIEGGLIKQRHLAANQIWANLVVILDRPMISGQTLAELTKNNPYALKEAAIADYNEAKVNTAYALLLRYYIQNTRRIVNKADSAPVQLICQIHRGRSAYPQLALFERLLQPWIKEGSLVRLMLEYPQPYQIAYYHYRPTNTWIMFKNGYRPPALEQSSEADVVLSFSLAAGLHQQWRSGSMLVPERFIPYGVASNELKLDQAYRVPNHLAGVIDELLAEQSQTLLAEIKKVTSENTTKQHQPVKLTRTDFKFATIVQADDIFNPHLSAKAR